jgi:outer membrane protein
VKKCDTIVTGMFNKRKTIIATLVGVGFFHFAYADTSLPKPSQSTIELPTLPKVQRPANIPTPVETPTIKPHTNSSAAFNYSTINHVLWPIVDHYTAFPNIPTWYANSNKSPLPTPHHTHFLTKLLTLRDVIWIALRNNPDVKNDEVTRITDKFALSVARYNFEPHFTDDFTLTKNLRANHDAQVATTGAVSLNNPFGGSISTSYNNSTKAYFDHRNTYTTTVKQSLMKGGWLGSWYTYLDAINTAETARLTFKSSIEGVITTVIGDYTSLVSAYNNLSLDKQNFKETVEQLKQDELKYKTGRISHSDLLQEQATYQTDKLNVVTEEDTVQTSYQSFLTELGLVPSSKIRIDQKIDTRGFQEPGLDICVNTALKYNTDYINAKLTVENNKRALTTAINGLMPTLDLTGTFGYGNGQTTTQSLVVNFSVPIDDMTARQGKLQAKITLEKSKISLVAERQSVISNVTTQWKSVQADIRQIKISESQVELQKRVVQDNYLLLQYGRTTMFQYLQERTTLLQNEQSLISNKITYMTDVATLDKTMGITLKRWNIKLRY